MVKTKRPTGDEAVSGNLLEYQSIAEGRSMMPDVAGYAF